MSKKFGLGLAIGAMVGAVAGTIWEHRLFLQKASSLEKEQVKMVKALITW